MSAGKLTSGHSPISSNGSMVATYSLLGCFAGHAVVAAASAIPLPEGVPADVGALIGCAVITGWAPRPRPWAWRLAVEVRSSGRAVSA